MNVTFMHSARMQQIRSLISLARKQNHLSVSKRQWAREAERAGMGTAAAKWTAEADRLRAEAVWHLEWAQRTKDLHHDN